MVTASQSDFCYKLIVYLLAYRSFHKDILPIVLVELIQDDLALLLLLPLQQGAYNFLH